MNKIKALLSYRMGQNPGNRANSRCIGFFCSGQKAFSKAISLALIFALLFSLIPWNLQEAKASDSPTVSSITIGKTFDSYDQATNMFIEILGNNLNFNQIIVTPISGNSIILTNPIKNSDNTFLKFQVNQEAWDEAIEKIIIGPITVPVSNSAMPAIKDVDPRSVNYGDDLTITGTQFDLLNDGVKIKYEDNSEVEEKDVTNGNITIKQIEKKPGLHSILFEREETITNFNNTGQDLTISIRHNYVDQFRIIINIDIPDLVMYPNTGAKGSKVYFESAAKDLSNYSVFFLKKVDGTDPYTLSNMGQNQKNTYPNEENNKYTMTVEIPDLDQGQYYVVLTNKIDPNKDPMEQVTSEKILTDRFTVIDATKSAIITDITPKSGPDSGSSATIYGRFLGSLNVDGLSLNNNYRVNTIVNQQNNSLVREFQSNDENPIGTYNGENVSSIKKEITGIIGGQISFNAEGSTFDNDIDTLKVNIPQINIPEGQPYKDVDVVIETNTILSTVKEDVYGNKTDNTYIFTERAQLSNGYRFIPSSLKPKVSSVVPDEIFVNGEYKIPEDLTIAIHGDNFTVTKYVYSDGTTNTQYPVVQFGSENDSNKIIFVKDKKGNEANVYEARDFKVLDSNGDIVDGSSGHDIGTTILLTIPGGTRIPSSYITNQFIPLLIKNPVRNSGSIGLISDPINIKFLNQNQSKIPAITSVTPDIVTVDGGETVTIEGSNFQADVKVYIAGQEVTPVTRGQDGKTITFKAPPGKEGSTQLQVINPGGGIAVKDFYYVKTYTDPKISDFAPKEGNTGTLVQIKGDNFLRPDPTARPDVSYNDIYRLIGTRVLLEGEDINQYNLDKDKKISLQNYVSPIADGKVDDIIRKSPDGSKVELANYWYSVVFNDGNNKYYTLSLDSQGNPILSDGVTNTFKLLIEENAIHAVKVEGSGDYILSVENPSSGNSGTIIHIKDINDSSKDYITLTMQTPYKVEDGTITGNKVKVVDKNTIVFRVPILTKGDGYYDLTVLNPDTKSDSRINEQGFYYHQLPQTIPAIRDIVPDKGSTDGGYNIDINGTNFIDNGTDKTRVFINGVEVKKEDVVVNVSGTILTVKVPPYTGDLSKDKNTDRITVPVVVLNPTGASASKEDGFTYMVPTSHPKITRIVPQQGSAAGGGVVEITGSDFRYFEPFNDDNRDGKKGDSELFNDINNNEKWDNLSVGDYVYWKNQYPDEEEFKKIVIPVLPKVYFGGKTADIMEFSDGYLKVLTPPGTAGDVDVYVVNNDSGISNKVKYTYKSSHPAVTKIVPAEGKKQGGDKVEIFGSDFVKSNNIKVYNSSDAPDVLVRFGDIANRDIPRDQENSGRIDNGRTTVNLAGGLTVEYTNSPEYGGQGQLNIQISEKGATYVSGNISYDGSVMFFPVSLLKDTSNNNSPYPGQELIRLEIQDRRLLVERGYAPQVTYVDSGHLEVTTPSYYTIGNVNVYVINPDGGVAQGQFEYKNPASRPAIVDITKEGNPPQKENINGKDVMVQYVTYKGGNIISVIGSDFRENAKIQISDVATIDPKDIMYTLPTKLTFTMPAVPESAIGKLHRVIVINEDGGTASSDEASPPIYIMFTKGETAPSVGNITPDHGPSTGGTTVKIEGKDFREGLKVYFGEVTVPQENVKVVDYKTIIVITPPHAPGKVEVKVENPDGELSTAGTFTYVSNPRISSVVDPQDPTEATRLTEISVEGGQEIKIKGSGFIDGAKVIFNPSVKAVDESQPQAGTVIYIDGKAYVLDGGVDGSDVKFIDSETLTVKTPPGKVGTGGIIVINPDGGATDIYGDITYGLPKLEAPMGVTAELSYDRYIKVNWSKVDKASQYEVYVVIDEKNMEFLDSTELTSYMYTNLEPYTRYKFVVKAVGDFGSSAPSAESNTVKTGKIAGPPDLDGKIIDDTKTQVSGDTQNVTIGVKDYTKPMTIDLTNQAAYKANNVMVQIPAEVVVKNDAGDITIIGKQFTIKFNPRVFSTPRVYDAKNRDDAGVRFTVTPYEGNSDLAGKIALSSQYVLKAEFFVGKDFYSLDYLASSIEIDMSYDKAKAQLRRLNHITLGRYDGERDAWDTTAGSTTGIIGSTVRAYVDRLGRYAVIGSRR